MRMLHFPSTDTMFNKQLIWKRIRTTKLNLPDDKNYLFTNKNGSLK